MLLGDTVSPPIRLHTLLTGFQTDGLSLVTLAIELGVAVWYVLAVRRLAKRGRHWSRWRTASFLGGTALVIVAVQSGLAAYDDQVFAAHVVQHLLLMNFAPILYALSAPMTLALQASDRRTQQGLLKVLHTPVVEFVTNPVLVVLVSYGTMIVYFLTPFYNFSLEHPLVHDLTHLHFLVSGCLFWWLVVGRDPFALAPVIPGQARDSRHRHPGDGRARGEPDRCPRVDRPALPLRGRHPRGGSILWIVGELTTFAAMAVIVFQWMRFEEREAVRADRLLDAQTQVLEVAAIARQLGPIVAWESNAVAAWERRGTYRTLLGLETFTIDVAATGGETLEPLLVVHGFPSSSFDYHHVVDALAEHRRVLLFDMVGYGLSAKPDQAYSVDLQADVAQAFVADAGVSSAGAAHPRPR